MSLNLKLVRGNEIRKAHLLPQNITELLAAVDGIFGSTDFKITYVDAEGDHITILNQKDLEAAYNAALSENRLFLKFFLEKAERRPEYDYIKESARQVESEDENEEFVVLESKPTEVSIPQPISPVIVAEEQSCPAPEIQLPETIAEETVPVNEVERPQAEEEEKRPKRKCGLRKAMKDAAKQFKGAFKPICKKFKEFKGCKPRIVPPCQGAVFTPDQVEFIRGLVREEAGLSKPVHSRYTCNGCGVHPITGVRYNCTVCSDFDFCEVCEANTEHTHPFIKHKTVIAPQHQPAPATNEVVVDLDLGNVLPFVPEKLKHIISKIQNKLSNKLDHKQKLKGLKGKAVAHLTLPKFTEVLQDTEYDKTWVLSNTGKVAWPAGSKLVHVRGRLATGSAVDLPSLAPGETAEVSLVLKTPTRCGKAKGVWQFQTPEGRGFGRVKCLVFVKRAEENAEPISEPAVILAEESKQVEVPAPVEESPAQESLPIEVTQLTDMGFTEEQARKALQDAENDIQLAVSMLFKRLE